MSGRFKNNDTAQLQRFKPYATYKASDAEWLGDIPASWKAVRVKRLFSVINGATPRSETVEYWDGDIPWVTPEDLGRLQSKKISETKRRITDEGYWDNSGA